MPDRVPNMRQGHVGIWTLLVIRVVGFARGANHAGPQISFHYGRCIPVTIVRLFTNKGWFSFHTVSNASCKSTGTYFATNTIKLGHRTIFAPRGERKRVNQFDCCCDRYGSTTAVIYIILYCRVEGGHLVRVKPTDDLGALRMWDPVRLRLLEGRELVLASGVPSCCATFAGRRSRRWGRCLRAPRGEFGHERWPSSEDRRPVQTGIVRLRHETRGVVYVSVITGAAAEVVGVEGGVDVGLTGGGAASSASMMIRSNAVLVRPTSRTTSQD